MEMEGYHINIVSQCHYLFVSHWYIQFILVVIFESPQTMSILTNSKISKSTIRSPIPVNSIKSKVSKSTILSQYTQIKIESKFVDNLNFLKIAV